MTGAAVILRDENAISTVAATSHSNSRGENAACMSIFAPFRHSLVLTSGSQALPLLR